MPLAYRGLRDFTCTWAQPAQQRQRTHSSAHPFDDHVYARRPRALGLLRIPLAAGIKETADLYRALEAAGKLTV